MRESHPTIDLDPRYEWRKAMSKGVTVYSTGREKSVRRITETLSPRGMPDLGAVSQSLSSAPGHFAVIASAENWCIAVTDRIASYQIFYTRHTDDFVISNGARHLARRLDANCCDPLAVTEFRMAGYVTGCDTMVRGIEKMRPAEILLHDQETGSVESERYYQFYSSVVRSESEDSLVEELDIRTDAIFRRLVEDADGRQIAVSLSGGLDSRLVLCKLKELGYRKLATFSYGMPGDPQVPTARLIADRLDVPWTFIPTSGAEARRRFWSTRRRDYWAYADHLHVVPNLHTFYALTTLTKEGQLQPDAVIVNGQTGDFISGNHIPTLEDESEATFDRLVQDILAKHYSMRSELLEHAPAYAIGRKRIQSVLEGISNVESYQEYAKLWELWEWQGRQALRVVHGQRNYDYFGFDWELPLWDIEYLEFWAEVPLVYKLNRRLFRRWLQQRNFYGIFQDFDWTYAGWPKGRGWMLLLGRVLTGLLGRSLSEKYYNIMRYFGSYGYLYAQHGFIEYLKRCMNYRTPIPFLAEIWEEENLTDGSGKVRLEPISAGKSFG